jgi:hypothetical protein
MTFEMAPAHSKITIESIRVRDMPNHDRLRQELHGETQNSRSDVAADRLRHLMTRIKRLPDDDPFKWDMMRQVAHELDALQMRP